MDDPQESKHWPRCAGVRVQLDDKATLLLRSPTVNSLMSFDTSYAEREIIYQDINHLSDTYIQHTLNQAVILPILLTDFRDADSDKQDVQGWYCCCQWDHLRTLTNGHYH